MSDSQTITDFADQPQPWINKASNFRGVHITMLTLVYIFIALRLYTRFWVLRLPGWDDIFVIFYSFWYMIGIVPTLMLPAAGFGKHVSELKPASLANVMKLFYIMYGSYNVSAALVKLSLLFQYMRIYDTDSRLHKICVTTAYLVGLWGCVFSILAWFPCWPVNAFWNRTASGQCWGVAIRGNSLLLAYLIHAATNGLWDLIVLVIPVPLLIRPHSDTKHKRAGLFTLFSLGLVVNALSVWRVVVNIRNQVGQYPTYDPTFYGPISVTLGVAEISIGAIAGSISVFWPNLIRPRLNQVVVKFEVMVRREPLPTQPLQYPENLGMGKLLSLVDADPLLHSMDDGRNNSERHGCSTGRGLHMKPAHYRDNFVAGQVLPFPGSTGSSGAWSEVKSERVPTMASTRDPMRKQSLVELLCNS
ncbi:uncharacterized protein BCR38DRAFT_433970 [Pseudomassariella vexata]|uniref:Rhodopsin domain-containing protein n=1 Tax=Pseudomassariella vexata TaxID=1141098 RepID=A0A1Y2DZN0_9PEZI|nr:uncharacterized protein BCR38DRAFT_433970 [Pseudomassariella vexata]ORY64085.1 hypothetical protein BCR38DRAFT_433970 [Pseudomassariella vexata]